MTTGVIDEFSDTDKDPGFYATTRYGAGAISLDSIPLKLLLVGLKATTGGTMAPDSDIVRIYGEDDARARAGARGELYRMARAALRVPGIEIWIAATAPPSGATAAQASITITGAWSQGGTWRYIIAGDEITGIIGPTDTPETVAAAIAAAVMSKPWMAVSATSSGGQVTLAWGSPGARGNDGILFQDKTGLPAGCDSDIAGGAAVEGDGTTGEGVYFTGGIGTEDITMLLTNLFEGRYHRIAFAQRDAENLARWEAQLDAKAGYDQGRMEHSVCATNRNLAAAQSSAQTTLNNWRVQLLWQWDGETPPPEVAAVFAAIRTLVEQGNPNVSYSGRALPGVAAQRSKARWPNRAMRLAAMNHGVTPVSTNSEGQAFIVRSITTRSQTVDGDPDYRTLDTSDAVVPDYVRDALRLHWRTSFLVANPYVRDDPAPEEPTPPAGAATPKLWSSEVEALLLALEGRKILTQVALNKPRSTFNRTAKRIASVVPVVRLPTQEQMEVAVHQQNYA